MKWIALTAAAGALLAVGAAPAFTADNGTVAVTVTAQPPPAPCLTVSPGAVGFGTLPFSANAGAGLSRGNADITVRNCGPAGQNILGQTTDATGPSGSWTPLAETGSIDPCVAVNRFYLYIFGFTNPPLFMTGTPAPVLAVAGNTPAVFPAASDTVFQLGIYMPCQGSNGAGEQKSITATFTAVVA